MDEKLHDHEGLFCKVIALNRQTKITSWVSLGRLDVHEHKTLNHEHKTLNHM